jgi:hypothetical protein
LSVSPATPAVGEKVTVYLRITRTAGSPAVGSFAAQITFDATAMQWTSMIDRGEGFVAANAPQNSFVLLAGANVQGFPTDTVVAISMTALKAGAPSLQLRMTELVTTTFESKLTTTPSAP